jgi:hypothetical protein
MFFSLLPDLEYSQQRVKYRFTDQDYVLAKNIFREFTFDNSIYNTDLFEEFTIINGARPDYVAELVYGDAKYDWILLLTNRVVNRFYDWPMSSEEFESYLYEKYDDPGQIRHYETIEIKDDLGQIVLPEGIISYYDPSDPDSFTFNYVKSYNPIVYETVSGAQCLVPVSHYEYETRENEKKSIIQILKPAYLKDFVKIFKKSVAYSSNENLDNTRIKKTLRGV